jgi:hypothetical protein
MHLKVFVKLKRTLKTLSSGQKNPKNPKKPKKTHRAGFFYKNPGFFQPWFAGFFTIHQGVIAIALLPSSTS